MPVIGTPVAGVASTGNNASVTPAHPAGLAVGNLKIIVAAIRNSGTGVPNVPTGWTSMLLSGNVRIMGRFHQSGDTAPLVTFTGGVANADTIARMIRVPDVHATALTTADATAAQLNASAANIAWPALAVPGDNRAVLLAAWKQDDATSIATPAGWTALGLTSTTTGDDALIALYHQVQTTDTDISSGSLVVTGGAAAISRALLLTVKPTAYIEADLQDVYPPRVLVSVTNLAVGDAVEIYRSVAGARTLVRAASDDAVEDQAFIRVDAELPFGVPVTYVAVVNGADEYSTAAVTYTLPGGKVVLSDAVSGLSAEVTIMAIGGLRYENGATRFQVGGRNVVVSGPMPGWAGQWELYVDTTVARDQVQALIADATEGVLQIRQPGGYTGVDYYVAVTGAEVNRWSADGTDERRLIMVDLVEVEGWAPALEAAGFTLQDIADAYDGLTLQDIGDDFLTLLDLAQADFS